MIGVPKIHTQQNKSQIRRKSLLFLINKTSYVPLSFLLNRLALSKSWIEKKNHISFIRMGGGGGGHGVHPRKILSSKNAGDAISSHFAVAILPEFYL